MRLVGAINSTGRSETDRTGSQSRERLNHDRVWVFPLVCSLADEVHVGLRSGD